MKGSSRDLIELLFRIDLEGLRKTTKNLKEIDGVGTEILTDDLPNTSLEVCRYITSVTE
jgi:hypothetical protein